MQSVFSVVAVWFSVSLVFVNAALVATEYIGEFFGKPYDESNVKKKVITLLVAIMSAGLCWLGAYGTFLTEMGIAGIVQVLGYLLTAVTIGMQGFYIQW